jgi:ParB-like chromosome segregation protein Spo0J
VGHSPTLSGKINKLRGQKFYQPIVSDGDEIIDGNHRLSVAKGEERKYVYIIEPLKSAANRIDRYNR